MRVQARRPYPPREGFESARNEWFYRPIGGGVELGEPAAEAIAREVREELGQEIAGIQQLGILENIFSYEGQPGHEIVFVFDAAFVDKSLYGRAVVDGYEVDREATGKAPAFKAIWMEEGLDSHRPGPVYPVGLLDLLARTI